MDAVVALLGAGIFAVVGHGMAMWFRMGKIEGKIEMVCKLMFDGKKDS